MATRFTIESDDGASLDASRASGQDVAFKISDGPFEIEMILNVADAQSLASYLQACSFVSFDNYEVADDEEPL